MQKYAFTLVELIVVITILAILGTIAFVSFQGYTSSARDSVRISDLKVIQKALEFELTKNDILPHPDNYITLSASGTNIGYQGYADTGALGHIGISDRILDPSDQTLYTFSTNIGRTKYQLLGFLEAELTQVGLPKIYADFTNRIPIFKGDRLGILVDESNNQPIQSAGIDIDVQNTVSDYKVLIENRNNNVSGTGAVIAKVLDFRINPNASCLNILQNGNATGDGLYNIHLKGIGEVEVYCDMTTDGGGWIRFNTLSDTDIGGVQNILTNIDISEINLDTGYDTDIFEYTNPSNLNTISALINDLLDEEYQASSKQRGRIIYQGSIVFGGGRNTPLDTNTGGCHSTRSKAWITTISSTKGTYCGYSYGALGRLYILNNAHFDKYSNDYFLGYSLEGPSHPGTCTYNGISLNFQECLDRFGVKKILIR